MEGAILYAFTESTGCPEQKKYQITNTQRKMVAEVWISMFRGLKFHVWEYEDNGWGAETNIYAAGRSEDIDGDYEEKISAEILSWPDMINN